MKRGNENKPHIGIYGRCNAGKSTLMNLLSAAQTAIVSEHKGTTTDPVKHAVEILDFAPVIIYDTAGSDDPTPLGKERWAKTMETLYQVDLAIIVFRGEWSEEDESLLTKVNEQGIPAVILHNRTQTDAPTTKGTGYDLLNGGEKERNEILNTIKHSLPEYAYKIPSLFEGIAAANDLVLLVCPIDSEAPAGRLILPQVQAIRDLLDRKAVAITLQPEQIPQFLTLGLRPKIVVTDSQVIGNVTPLFAELGTEVTTFSILLAKAKGDMPLYKQGLQQVARLKDGDKILILESCSHQTSCEDIGRVKIPQWLREYTGKELSFDIVAKLSALPQGLEHYALAVQCGGCMVTRRQLQGRIKRVAAAGVPITNYGMLIKLLKA